MTAPNADYERFPKHVCRLVGTAECPACIQRAEEDRAFMEKAQAVVEAAQNDSSGAPPVACTCGARPAYEGATPVHAARCAVTAAVHPNRYRP